MMTSASDVPALALVDIGAEGVALLTEPQWTDGDRNSRTLFKADTLRVVLTALRAGAVMQNADPDESVGIQPVQGEIAVRVGSQEIPARSGELVCVGRGEPWEVRASADSLFLLTVGRSPQPAGTRSD
jgi:quercetin dioxygenase-like cupin family protein